jgi:hypothetical protein
MEHHEEERTLSTADLADRNPDDPTASREGQPTDEPLEATDQGRREETDGRYDQLEDEEGAERVAGSERMATTTDTDVVSPLFDEGVVQRFQDEWETIQAGFVDEPRGAVERADTLVADLMQRLAAGFAEERSRLEAQWDRGDEVSTEDLRIALQRYRSFFGRLLQA